ncbi:MAG: septum formation protein Maf [Candidatus Marinimicrobia bacterium]|nr:septum formation protein Maf [Candidatus Neomarinimicrobiota bacterium]
MHAVELILASSSPRRKTLLKQIGLRFRVQPSHVEEPSYEGGSPKEYARSLAALKAAEVSAINPYALVLGADTIVVVDDIVLGKPGNTIEADRMLKLLSGRSHEVITAYSLQLRDQQIHQTYLVSTLVYFKTLDPDDISHYIDSGNPFDKAGSYGIQDFSSVFVDRIEGCFYNVVGLPISDLNSNLKQLLLTNDLELE